MTLISKNHTKNTVCKIIFVSAKQCTLLHTWTFFYIMNTSLLTAS